MRLKATVLLLLLTISMVSVVAVEYEGMITTTTKQFNNTIEADPDDNTSMKETRIVTVQEIRQKNIQIDDDLVAYEPYTPPPEPEPEVYNETVNKTVIGVVIIDSPIQEQEQKEPFIETSTIIGILILIIAFCIAIILVNKGRKKSRLTPEEVAKSLLDAGHDESYVETVYEKLKRDRK